MSASLAIVLGLVEGLSAQGPSLRVPQSDRLGFFQGEWNKAIGGALFLVRDTLGGRVDPSDYPDNKIVDLLSKGISQAPAALAGYDTNGRVVWSMGSVPDKTPELPSGKMSLYWTGSPGLVVDAWMPAAMQAKKEDPRWYFLRLDMAQLMSKSMPSNQLIGTESLYAWRRDTGELLAHAAAEEGAGLLALADQVRRRNALRDVLSQARGPDPGVTYYPCFSHAKQELVRSRLFYRPLSPAGLEMSIAIETEVPFVGDPQSLTGRWSRVGGDGQESYDFLHDGTWWALSGRGVWQGLAVEGRDLDSHFASLRVLSDRGIPGLNSLSGRWTEDGVFQLDVYLRKAGGIHHYVYHFLRNSVMLPKSEQDLPLKIQLQ